MTVAWDLLALASPGEMPDFRADLTCPPGRGHHPGDWLVCVFRIACAHPSTPGGPSCVTSPQVVTLGASRRALAV